MAHEPDDGATTIHASKGSGGGWKVLAGAVVAAALAGGGYYAWQNYGPSQSSANLASNEQQFSDTANAPIQAGPLPAQQQAQNSTASPDESGSSSSASSQSQTAPAAPAPRRAASRAAAAPASEEVIGVTPASAIATPAAQESDPIIVEGQRRPVWSRTPAAWRLAEAYPTRALEQGREGEASLHCTVLNNGALDCAPVSEYPARSGFGGAALRVAHMYRHGPTRRDGTDAIGTPVNLKVVFRIDDNDRRRG